MVVLLDYLFIGKNDYGNYDSKKHKRQQPTPTQQDHMVHHPCGSHSYINQRMRLPMLKGG
jgi:hypothetical protein